MQELIVDNLQHLFEQLQYEYNSPKEIKVNGDNILINCPFHDDQHPTMNVYNKENGVAPFGYGRCWACNDGWNLRDIIEKIIGGDANDWLIDHNYLIDYDVIDFNKLIGGWNFDKPIEKQKIVYKDESEIEEYCKWYHPYMQKRGLSPETCKRFKIGYDKESKSITFPVYDENNNLITITRRCVDNKMFSLEKNISKPIYLINNAVQQEQNDLKEFGCVRPIFVVESQINALTLEQWGYTAIALFGTGCKEQYDKIKQVLLNRKFYLCFDGDTAGDIGANKFKNYFTYSIRVPIPNGKDVNDMTEEEFKKIIEKY